MKCTNWVNWNKLIETQRNWNQWTGMKELKQSNWHEWMNERMNEWMQEGRNEWMNESMNEWMNDWMTMNGRMYECMNEWRNEWMHEWMNAWMNAWTKSDPRPSFFYERLFKPEFTHSRPVALATTWWWVRMMMWLASWWHYDDVVDIWNRALATVLCTFCRPHLPKVLQTRKFFNILRLFPTSSSKNAPNPTVFACSSSGNWALDTVSWHVVHRPKVLQARQFFYASYVKSSSHYSCAHFVDLTGPVKSSSRYSPVQILPATSPIEPQNPGNRDPPSATSSHFTGNNRRFRARECFQDFSSLNSRIPDLARFPTITYMMMWLPWWLRWWCGCHHGEKASHDNCS